jgi:Asp-tRNA(Asn)/Glu-tRNA(Gln) amidotransferase A subunit family amidase
MSLRTEKHSTARKHIEACLARIDAFEPALQAFQSLDAEQALVAAVAMDKGGKNLPLAGLALGVKDIIDAVPYPTGCGSPIHAERVPRADAACVAQLRAAGAVVLGKTVTTEFAFFSPGPTRNPHDGKRTPGGSSSGSAAATAAGFIDAGLGSQTAASITRPASFCGVVGFKPSFGTYSLAGVKGLSPSFDTLGALTRDATIMAAVHAVLANPIPAAPVAESIAPRRVGICRTPWWDKAEQATRDAIAGAAKVFSTEAIVEDVNMDAFADAATVHAAIMTFEAAQGLAAEMAVGREKLSPVLFGMLETGMRITRDEHVWNLRRATELRKEVQALTDRYDVLVAPAATGEAPVGLAATGDPIFSRVWTLLRLPAITLPGFIGPNRMPVGIQLISRLHDDERLLAHALWAERLLPKAPAPTAYRSE